MPRACPPLILAPTAPSTTSPARLVATHGVEKDQDCAVRNRPLPSRVTREAGNTTRVRRATPSHRRSPATVVARRISPNASLDTPMPMKSTSAAVTCTNNPIE